MNEVILIDPGPDVAQSIARIGKDLRETKHWLITHGHHDHLDPVLLLSRSWAIGDQPLVIWGPPNAIDALAPWIPPKSCIHAASIVAPLFLAQLLEIQDPYMRENDVFPIILHRACRVLLT